MNTSLFIFYMNLPVYRVDRTVCYNHIMCVLKVFVKFFYHYVNSKIQKINKLNVKSSVHIVWKVVSNTSVNIHCPIYRFLYLFQNVYVFLYYCAFFCEKMFSSTLILVSLSVYLIIVFISDFSEVT